MRGVFKRFAGRMKRFTLLLTAPILLTRFPTRLLVGAATILSLTGLALAPSVSASAASGSARSGDLHVTKECSQYAGLADSFCISGLSATPDRKRTTTYTQLAVLAVTGNALASFDIGWSDRTGTYYLADKTNAAIDFIAGKTGTMLGQATGFAGVKATQALSGPNGVTSAPNLHEVWAGDGDSTVKVVDTKTFKVTDTISTGGKFRADELSYDPKDHVILVANDADQPPFVTFISTTSKTVLGKIEMPQATMGLEQSGWDAETGLFYISVPTTTTNPGGELDELDPTAMKISKVFPLTNCNPAGLGIAPHSHVMVGCTAYPANVQVVDARNGSTLATITKVGGVDEVFYNSGANQFYVAAQGMTADGTKTGAPTPVVGIIDARTNEWLQNIPTVLGAHSVAADPRNNHIFVPQRGRGVVIYGPSECHCE
jgi:DNA-binding beta-propeller fold protein YncE